MFPSFTDLAHVFDQLRYIQQYYCLNTIAAVKYRGRRDVGYASKKNLMKEVKRNQGIARAARIMYDHFPDCVSKFLATIP